MKPAFVVLLVLLAGLSTASCTTLRSPPPDSLSAAQHEDRAEQLIQNQDYPGAAAQLALAIAQTPDDTALYLQQGSLLEALGHNEAAENAYRTGLRRSPPGSSLAADFSYHLALFYLLVKHAPGQARPLVPAVPTDSIPGMDLQAVLQLQQGTPRQALRIINQALAEEPDDNEMARLLYHGALAYRRLKDNEDQRLALLRAVSRAEDPDLENKIAHLWALLPQQ